MGELRPNFQWFEPQALREMTLEVRLPAKEESTEVLWVPRLLDEAVHLTLNAGRLALLRAHQLLLKSQQRTLGDLVHLHRRSCKQNKSEENLLGQN